jgi:hypothetical protein
VEDDVTDFDAMVAWLGAQLDEDEEAARDAGGSTPSGHWAREAYGCVIDAKQRLVVYGEGTPTREGAEHIARHDPARVLREVEAKRALLEETIRPYLNNGQTTGNIAWLALRLLALPYSDRPGYRAEWAP